MDIIGTTGIIAAICTTSSFIPQALKTIKTRDTSGISLQMYVVFTFGTAMWLIYGILTNNTPVIAANTVTVIFALIILGYKLKYK